MQSIAIFVLELFRTSTIVQHDQKDSTKISDYKQTVDRTEISVHSPPICNNNSHHLPNISNNKQLYKNTVHRVPNNNHFISSQIIKFYKKPLTDILSILTKLYIPKDVNTIATVALQ